MKVINKIYLTLFSKWFEIIILIFFNILSVTVILSKWSVEEYGIWLLFQIVYGVLYLPNMSLSEYVYNENFKKGKNNKKSIFLNIFSALPFAIINSLLIILLLLIDKNFLFSNNLLNIPKFFNKEWNLILIIFSIIILFTSTIVNFFNQYLSLSGYYPHFSWLLTVRRTTLLIIPLILIFFFNFDLFNSIISLAVIDIMYYLTNYFIIFKLIRKKIKLKFDFFRGFNFFKNSLIILLKNLIENLSGPGIRIIISFIYNPITVVIFSAMRTIANIFRQITDGLRDFLIPEFSEIFIKKKIKVFQLYLEIYLTILIFLFFPTMIILQFFTPKLFDLWTLGKIVFDDKLFLILNSAVLIYSTSFPLKIILQSKNLIYFNLKLSILYIIIVITFIWIANLKSVIFLIGIGILCSEFINFFIIINKSKKILSKDKMQINFRIFYICLLNLFFISYFCFFLIKNKINTFETFVLIIVFLLYIYSLKYFLTCLSKHTIEKISHYFKDQFKK